MEKKVIKGTQDQPCFRLDEKCPDPDSDVTGIMQTKRTNDVGMSTLLSEMCR